MDSIFAGLKKLKNISYICFDQMRMDMHDIHLHTFFFLKNAYVTTILRTGFLKSICNDYFFQIVLIRKKNISFVYSWRFSKHPQNIFDCHWLMSFLPFIMYISNSVIEKNSECTNDVFLKSPFEILSYCWWVFHHGV